MHLLTEADAPVRSCAAFHERLAQRPGVSHIDPIGGVPFGEAGPWYDVDAALKQERLDWAYGVVTGAGYDPNKEPRPQPPPQLRRSAQTMRTEADKAAASRFGEPLL